MFRRKLFGFALAVTLAGCGNTTPPDTVDALVADPAKLKDVMRQCHEDHVKVGDAECNAASEAFRRRFTGSGTAQPNP